MAEIPKIVSQRLHAAEREEVHPDPDLITAFVEKSLGNRERVQVLEHLSGCADCREIAALSATRPDVADAVSVPAGAGWLSWSVLRWGAAVACVIVVGAAVQLRHKQEAPQIAPTFAKQKLATEAQVQAPDSALAKKTPSLPLPHREATSALMAKQTELGQAGTNSAATQPVLGASANAPAAASGSMFAMTANRQNVRPANPPDENHAAATSSTVEMADARTGSPLIDVVPGRAKAAGAESQDAQSEKAIGGTLLRKKTMAVPAGAANIASDASIPANLAPRWTLSSDGTLQRSLDSGGSWQTIPVSSKTIFRALAANGLDIWVGGSAGGLFHSSNAGQDWKQVRPIANGEALTDDIIGVEFTDTLHGKVTTSVEETWITADAGQTWQKQ